MEAILNLIVIGPIALKIDTYIRATYVKCQDDQERTSDSKEDYSLHQINPKTFVAVIT